MNQIKHKILFILALVSLLQLSSNKVKAQYAEEYDEYNPSVFDAKNDVQNETPGSALLSGIGSGNVELYTGRASYSVPIFNLKSKDIEVPIALSYISAGVKIQQVADWVGIDWNLQPGGIIRREVKNLPDELPDKGYFAISGLVDLFLHNVLDKFQKRDVINNKDLDYQPDVFHFFAGKYSGSFMFDGDQNIHFFPYQNIKATKIISSVSKKIVEFTLTTPDGLVYTYGNNGTLIEETFIETETYPIGKEATRKVLSNDLFNTTWYLYKIESPSGDWIEFKYSNNRIIKYVDAENTTKYQLDRNVFGDNNLEVGETYVYNHDGQVPEFYHYDWLKRDKAIDYPYLSGDGTVVTQNRYFIQRRYLNEINCKTGTSAKFTVLYNRSDLPGAGKLSSVEILNNLGTSIKKINLDYTTYTSKYMDAACKNDPFTFTEMSIVKHVDVNTYGLPANQGIYIIDLHDGSWSLDIENFTKEALKHYNYDRFFLTKITDVKNTKIKSTLDFTYINPDELQRRTSSYVDFYGYNLSSTSKKESYGGNSFQFTSAYPFLHYLDSESNTENVRQQLANASTNGLLEKVESSLGETLEYIYVSNNSGAGCRVRELKRSDRSNSLSVFYDYFEPEMARFHYRTHNWFYNEYGEPNGDFSACTRFKILIRSSGNLSTENSIYNGSPIIYNRVEVYNDLNRSNGYNKFEFYNQVGSASEVNSSYSPKIWKDLIWDHDFIHQYGEGTWELHWQKYDDHFNVGNPYGFPGMFYYLNNNYRGILKENTVKNSTDQIIKKTTYNYLFNIVPPSVAGTKINGLIGSTYKFALQWVTYYDTWVTGYEWGLKLKDAYIANIYSLTPETYHLESVIDSTFSSAYPGNVNYVNRTVTNYSYNNFGQIKTVSSIDSKGNEIKTIYKYPLDFWYQQPIHEEPTSIDELAVAGLLFKNMINTPIETIVLKNNKVMQGNINRFLVIPSVTNVLQIGNSHKIVPFQTYSLETSNPIEIGSFTDSKVFMSPTMIMDGRYKLRNQFDSYDSYGNLTQYHKYNNNTNSFLWGYNGQYPIAEVVNATSNETFYTSFEGNEEDLMPSVGNNCVSTYFHSGKKSLEYTLTNPSLSAWERRYEVFKLKPVISNLPKRYKYSGWVYSNGPIPNVSFYFRKANGIYNSTLDATTTVKNRWTYVEGEFTLPAVYGGSAVTDITLWVYGSDMSGKIWFDDLRLHPSEAQMTAYTYEPLVGMTSATGPDNKTATYEYDDFGRLKLDRDHNGDILNKYTYHYKGENLTETIPDPVGNLTVSVTNLFFRSAGVSRSFTISSNVHWTITTDVDWLNITPVSGSNDATINVNCVFEAPDETGTITITGGGITKTINVQQIIIIKPGDIQ